MTMSATHERDPRLVPFHLHVPQEELDDLQDRLARTRLPTALPDDSWGAGVPVAHLRSAVSRWASYDWRETEARLNRLPQFTTVIDGQQIHFIHVRSAHAGAVPLLITHGWPGSILEFEDLIGPLTDPTAHDGSAADAFDVVIPSLPGFGFSTPLVGQSWTVGRIASTWVELMNRLGYERFAVQGGDIGADVAPEIGRLVPERVVGVHVNGALGKFVTEVDEETAAGLTPLELDRIRRVEVFMQNEFGYIALQSTRPGLLGAMTADSPVATMAWVLDKLQAWTHPAQAPAEDVLGTEFVLANVTLYWLTASAGSAAFVGYAQDEGWGQEPESSGVPTAAIQFAHDIGLRHLAEQSNDIVRWTDVPDRGGHFAALEEPEILIEDIRDFVRPLRDTRAIDDGTDVDSGSDRP